MSYSQNDEDGYLMRLIVDGKLKIPAYFVDFGSCDGIHLNNCRLFAEQGWGGIFCEPNSTYFAQLKANYQHRADIETINAAVSNRSGFEIFYRYPNHVDHSGLHDKPKFEPYYSDQVAVVEASDLIKQEVGIMSIDVEGQEQNILIDLFTAGIYPCILIVESNTAQDRKEQIDLLNERYHLLNVLDVNTIWIRRDKWL